MAAEEAALGQRAEAVLVDEQADGTLDIGGIRYQIVEPANPELVPDIVFFEIPSHTLILRSMLKDYLLGEVSAAPVHQPAFSVSHIRLSSAADLRG